MNRLFVLSMTCLIMFFFACETEEPLAPILSDTETIELDELFNEESCCSRDRQSITVMTRNVYVGADVDMVIEAPIDEVPFVVGTVYQQLFETDFPARARSLAREIDHSRPHFIGLQEISLIRYDENGDAIDGALPNAKVVVFDYLKILKKALKRRGLHYKVAGIIENADVEVPMVVGMDETTGYPIFHDVRLTDMDVVLVQKKVKVLSVDANNFGATLGEPPIIVPRGYVSVKARINKNEYRFINTHLEAFDPVTRQEQADELLAIFANETLPTIMVGDFNAPAPLDPTYLSIINPEDPNAGYTDIWMENRNQYNPDGFTYGHELDLKNEFANFTERIDFIFIRNFNHVKIWANVVGDEYRNKTRSGLWPSDHGGVVALMKISDERRHYSTFH
jgi:endonuclease/exonuclease/phosphatase family metal-dependent hydrolase